jgi:uncharacterized membrane protein YhiD involved in acid resistance
MNKIQTFAEFLATQSPNISILSFVINLILAVILGYVLSKVYIKYGESLSNRKMFSKNFILITATTMIIITIVKSSLALSLGLVGALSIVRFRAAIKEPEELAYLFISIAIGLGFGADQTLITIIGFFMLIAIIALKNMKEKKEVNQNLVLTITSGNPRKLGLDEIIDVLKQYCSVVNFKRLDEKKEILEATFLVEFENFEKFNKGKIKLQEMNESIHITFLDNKGIV